MTTRAKQFGNSRFFRVIYCTRERGRICLKKAIRVKVKQAIFAFICITMRSLHAYLWQTSPDVPYAMNESSANNYPFCILVRARPMLLKLLARMYTCIRNQVSLFGLQALEANKAREYSAQNGVIIRDYFECLPGKPGGLYLKKNNLNKTQNPTWRNIG